MANLTLTSDLLEDALDRAGEPTDGTSDYATRALVYLNVVLRSLILGGPFGSSDGRGFVIPVIDWAWAKKNPRGVFNTVAPVRATVTLTQDSTAARFAVAPGTNLSGYHLKPVGSAVTMKLVSRDLGDQALYVLDAPYPDASGSVSVDVVKIEYQLAADFVRPCGQPSLTVYPYKLKLVDQDVLEDLSPVSQLRSGTPWCAAILASGVMRLNAYPNCRMRIEYPYIAMPAELTGTTNEAPPLPLHHRRILSTAAAAMITFDKSDDKTVPLMAEAQSMLEAMMHEYHHTARRGSSLFGRIAFRLNQLNS